MADQLMAASVTGSVPNKAPASGDARGEGVCECVCAEADRHVAFPVNTLGHIFA